MKTLDLSKFVALVLACAAFAMATTLADAGVIKANGGTTFTFEPVAFDVHGNPVRFTHTVDGVVRVS
ncbi:MAG TPA: hypothetical protein VL361_12220 [Candidatus Limnocylindrales bacterium]|nr:hypothetical protein [Candidatus Limnocylindrales bacterium]